MPPPDFPVVVAGIVEEAADTRTFRLELAEGTRFDFQPGQFVQVAFPEEPGLRRAYSIASAPAEPGALEITVSRVARLSTRLFDLRGGESLLLSGPLGTWTFREEFTRAVLASEGTGVAPLRSMARHVLGKGLPHRLSLVCGFASSEAVLYRTELAEFQRRGVDVHMALGAGALDGAFLRERVPDLSRAACYLCGPNRLVDRLRAALAEAGVPSDKVFHEKWGDY